MDLTLPAARGERDQLSTRTDVLDKVGVLATLPDDMHCTTDMVATYYEVDREAIASLVKRNRDEFEDDGYAVMVRSVFEERFTVNLSANAARVALFPRRSVLRVGMLLRDSGIARQVRDYLLDVERDQREDSTVTFLIPKTLPEALRLAADQAERAELAEAKGRVLEARIEKDAPLVAKAEAHSTSDSMIHRQAYAREVQQWGQKRGLKILHEHVYELLRRRGMLVAGDRSDRNHATSHAVKSGWAWTKKDVTDDGHATAVTYLHPRGQDIAWKWITKYVDEFGDLRPRDGVA